MKEQKVLKHSKNTMTIQCKDTVSTVQVSAFISYGEILDVSEGDWRSEESIFKKNDPECSIGEGTVQEAMASLINDWPQFYDKVKRYALKDKLWSEAKAEEFARKVEIEKLTTRIDQLNEDLTRLSQQRARLQRADLKKLAKAVR